MMREQNLQVADAPNMAYDAALTAGNFKPILFSTPMVQAILRGEKTQTRRIINPQPTAELFSAIIGGYDNIPKMARFWTKREPNNPLIEDVELKYSVGDILWVRETTCYVMLDHAHDLLEGAKDRTQIVYKASVHSDWMEYAKEKYGYKWKPSIFMPKEACRIFIKLKSIRIERLNDISESDAIDEGAIELLQSRAQLATNGNLFFDYSKKKELFNEGLIAKESYRTLWQKINGEKSWAENPFVWIYEFERTDASFACS